MKHTEYDAVALGEQREPEGNALIGAVYGLLAEAVCAAVVILIYEAVKLFMR